METIKIIKPKVELYSELGVTSEQHIARCARVCYGGEDKLHTLEQDKKLVDGLVRKGHLSMLRHSSVYLDISSLPVIIQEVFASSLHDSWYNNLHMDYNPLVCNMQEYEFGNIAEHLDNTHAYLDAKEKVMTNAEYLGLCTDKPDNFNKYRLTFCITTQIATSRELNRKSPNNIAERSTRYCSSKEGVTICEPWWWDDEKTTQSMKDDYIYAMSVASQSYNDMLKDGFKPQDARGVLPLDTATKVIYTYSIGEWKQILDLRLYDKYGVAHPNCKVVMQMVKDQINQFAKEHNIEFTV